MLNSPKVCYNIFKSKVKFSSGKHHEKYIKEFNMNEDEWREIYTLAFSLTQNRQLNFTIRFVMAT